MARIMATPPLVLDMSTRTAGKLPDGRTVPLAWSLSTPAKIYMKTAPYMPWGDTTKVDATIAAGGVYIAALDEWFRGVWEPAPPQVLDADYTAQQLLPPGQRQALLKSSIEDEHEQAAAS